jgi:hypothetical protein
MARRVGPLAAVECDIVALVWDVGNTEGNEGKDR